MKDPISIFWFRRDLRLEDNTGLFYALSHAKKAGQTVLPIFIFDKRILDQLEDKEDRRVDFIHQAIIAIQDQLEAAGKSLRVEYGRPAEI
ncbi:MAG: deoxyribodipyrimidine photo-lyase, partial [Sediminibacterium sp.]